MNTSSNYPAMDPDSCDSIGLSGWCGINCPLFLRGDCEMDPQNFLEAINDTRHDFGLTQAHIDKLNDMYNYKPIPRKPKSYDDYDRAMKGLIIPK